MRRLLKLMISVALVVLAFHLLDVRTILDTTKGGSASSFAIAVILNILAFFVMGLRWHLLIAPGVPRTFLAHMGVYLKGTFLNTFTPANLGGDAYRLAVLRKKVKSSGVLVKLLLRERILGLYGYVIVFALAYMWVLPSLGSSVRLTSNPYTYGAILALGVLILPFVAEPLGRQIVKLVRHKVGTTRIPKLESWAETGASLFSPKGVLPLMLLTILGVVLWIASIKIIGDGFAVSIPLTHLAAVATLVEIIRLVPLTIQGIGLREGVFAYLLNFLGHSPEQCYVVGAVSYLALSLAIILCGPLGQAVMWLGRAGTNAVGSEERIE